MRPELNEDSRNKSNIVEIEGVVTESPVFHHSTYGEDIYSFMVEIERLTADVTDVVRVEVSNRLVDIDTITEGSGINIIGQYRSFNKANPDGRRSLELFVFARELEIIDASNVRNLNNIHLDGYLCKDVTHRVTPKGREIGDMLIAVNRNYGKSDYIPSICWGRNARFASNLSVGTPISIDGRIQSRRYIKKVSDTETIEKTAYEVSVSRICVVDDYKGENNTEDKE